MILKDKDERIILWGCHIGEDSVYAELGFFDSNLYSASYLLSSVDGQTRVLVSLGDEVKAQMFPSKVQHIGCSIISAFNQ